MAKLQWPSASIVLIALLLAPLPVVATDEDDWSQARAAGVAAFGRKDYVAAEKQYQLALKLTASMKQSDPRVAESMEDLAKLYARQKKFAEARATNLKILKLKESIYGMEDKALIGPLNDVIKVTCAGGLCYETMPELKRLLAIRQKAFGENSNGVPVTLQLIGEAYEKHKDYGQALKYFRQAVSVQKQISGEKSTMVINLSRNIDRILKKQAAKAKA